MSSKSQVSKLTSVKSSTSKEDDPPISPAEYIENEILGPISQSELADRLDVTRAAVNMLIKGKRRLTAGMAMRFERVTGKPAIFWLDLQRNWDDWSASSAGQAYDAELRSERLLREWMSTGPRILTNAEIIQAVANSFVSISPFLKNRIKPASYDLSIGKVFNFDNGERLLMDDEHDCFHLEARTLYTVSTFEEIQLSARVVARIAPSTDLIDLGLFFSVGLHVDPGFGMKGGGKATTLVCLVENRSSKPVSINCEDVFLSCEFTFLAKEAILDNSEIFPGRGPGGEFFRHYTE